MKTEVAILHHEYPARLRATVAARLESLLRSFEGTVSVRAVLEREAGEHRVELVSSVPRGVVLRVDARADSIGAALDDALSKLRRVLTRRRERLREAPRRRARSRS